MRFFDRLFPDHRAHELILVWERGAKQDLLREIEAWPEEGPTMISDKKGEKALLKAFLDTVESRLVAHIVKDSFPPSVAPKTDNKEGAVVSVKSP